MINNNRHSLLEVLAELESELKIQQYWQANLPDPDLFVSEMPFYMDKMNGYEWLQWVFIPKFKDNLMQNKPIASFAIYPYFEEVLQKEEKDQVLHQLIQKLDKLVEEITKKSI